MFPGRFPTDISIEVSLPEEAGEFSETNPENIYPSESWYKLVVIPFWKITLRLPHDQRRLHPTRHQTVRRSGEEVPAIHGNDKGEAAVVCFQGLLGLREGWGILRRVAGRSKMVGDFALWRGS